MTTRPSPTLPSPAPDLAGTWKLPGGRAATLRPVTDGILRVASGRLWATVDGPHGGRPDDAGDHILQLGRSMYVRAGERVVIESWDPDRPAHFAWDPVAAAAQPALAQRRLGLAGVL
ncbi:MAG TPA: DUF2917 domain-containing protein, partial [Ramlibacter sp.]|nr:DUF2917 domain-containing protein [Ramlibacter sp.]